MMPLAGLVSVLAYYGFVSWGDKTYYRYVNPLLGVNGFWLFGLVSAFLLHRALNGVVRGKVGTVLGYGLLWGLGFAGAVLSGNRGGMVLLVLSVFWVMWYYRPLRVRRGLLRVRARHLVVYVALLGLLAVGWGMEEKFGVLRVRTQEEGIAEASTVSKRIWIAEIALAELPARVIWGAGLNQFQIVHPESPDTIHNYYLQVLYETGAIGLTMFVWLLLRLLGRAYLFGVVARGSGDEVLIGHANASLFAVLGAMVAGLIYPIPFTRFEWLIVLLASLPAPRRCDWRLGMAEGRRLS